MNDEQKQKDEVEEQGLKRPREEVDEQGYRPRGREEDGEEQKAQEAEESTGSDDDDDQVDEQAMRWSDRVLKRSIAPIAHAVSALHS